MVRSIFKRFVATTLALLLIVTLIPNMALAANVNTGVDGLTADSSDDGTWSASGGTITGSVTALPSSGCSGTTYTARTATLTFTNSSGAVGLLTFDYSLTLAGGSATVDGAAVTAGAGFSKTLAAGETVVVSITSPGNEDTASMVISNLKLTAEANVDVTFKAPANGSYTVNGDAITADTVKTVKTTDSVTLAATASSSYKFLGWRNETNDSYLSMTTPFTTSFAEPITVAPVFVKSSVPVFQVGSKMFTDLNEATAYAQSSSIAKIALVSNGTLPAGSYTIPSGKTLVIPFDDAQTVFTTAPGMTVGADGKPAAYIAPSAFRTLTMAENAKITVESGGAISVPSMLSAVGTNSGSWNATPTGKHGRITMNAGSSIDVQSGGKLYVYGYISGSGNVYAGSGSELWEAFQIRCWRGGTATSDMADNSQKVFPLNQYYVQNIEAPVTYYPGATEKVFAAVNMSNQQFGASATFIGSGGMFNVESGSATKRFTGATDRLELTVDGNFSITPMSLKITGLPLIGTLDLNTADYVLPIQSNITLNVNSGTTTLSQDVAFLPGSEMNIADSATVTVASGHKAYVYDKDQWGAYAASGQQLVVVGYSTVNGTTAKRTAASLVDVKIDVNGTLHVAGSLYTTEGGAAIVSTGGTGKVVLQAAPGSETKTYQATQSGSNISYVDIPITAAKLQNADGSYYETAGKPAGTTVPYYDGEWGKEPPKTFTVTYDANGGKGAMEPQTFTEGKTGTLNANTFTKTGYHFIGWNTMADGSGTSIPDGYSGTIPGASDMTLYAQWAINFYEIRFFDGEGEDAKQIGETQLIAYGSEPTTPDVPTKETDEYYYTFAGWVPPVGPATKDTDYIATFSSTTKEYTIIFKNGDEVLQSGSVKYGETPSYTGETPTKASDAQYEYEFLGWAVEDDQENNIIDPLPPVKGDATYKAVFKENLREYTITFVDEDGTELQSGNVAYGETPVYNGTEPSKQGDNYVSYAFVGWTPDPAPVTGETTYTATYTASYAYVLYGEINGDQNYGWRANSENLGDYIFVDGILRHQTADGSLEAGPITFAQDAYVAVKRANNLDWYAPATYPGDSARTAALEKLADPSGVSANTLFRIPAGKPITLYLTEEQDGSLTLSYEVPAFAVTFVNDDGSTLLSQTVEYGDIPEYTGPTPTKAQDEQYTYTFNGWDKELVAVTEDVTYTATYTQTTRTYTITFVGEDGTELQSSEVAYGDYPVYHGEQPVKEATAQYTYEFHWTPEIVAVSGPATYTASFTPVLRSYAITWLNDDGTLFDTTTVAYGDVPSHEPPQKQNPEEGMQYVFAGWTPVPTAVTGEATYTASFTGEKERYEVRFFNEDGTQIGETQMVEYGSMPSIPAAPEKAATAEFTYSFNGWVPEVVPATGNADYTASYTATTRSYKITWLDDDGTILDTTTVEYGTVPTHDAPVKENAQYKWTFLAWDPAPVAVTGEATYKATYSEPETKEYTIRFLNDDGTELQNTKVPYGTMPEYVGETPNKTADAQFTYSFKGWDPELEMVTGDATYTAKYDKTVNKYTIKFVNEDGTELQSSEVPYGETPVYNGATPTKDPTAEYVYVFSGWDSEIENVTCDKTYTAQFQAEIRKYQITFVDDDGTTVLWSGEFQFGVTPEYGGDPVTKEADAQYSYQFIGWEPELTAVDGEKTYKAVYETTLRSYTITWLNEDGSPIDTTTVSYGAMPAHDPATKPETMLETYEFAGWTPELTEVTGDAEYTAKYTTVPKSGWIEWEGTQYFVVNGAVVKGVYQIEDDFYIFDLETGAFRTNANGITDVGEDTYLAENGKVVKNAGLVRIAESEEYYYFGEDNKALKNQRTWIDETNGLLPVWAYTFTSTGAIEHVDVSWEGLQSDGYTYIDGIRVYLGLVQEADGSYHYYNSSGLHIVGRSYWISKTNPETVKDPNGNPFPEGSYEFDAQGRMILPGDPAAKNGIVAEDGSLFYYVDNVRTYAGLIKIGNDYYYVRYGGEVVHGTDYWVTKNNDLMPSARYNFADDGKMILVQPKNGIVAEDNSLYYYVDGARTYAGLIKINDDYYYVRQSGEVVHGVEYWVTKNNGLVPSGRYTFGEDGKMVLTGTPLDTTPEPEVKNGIYEEDGVKYYYENGVKKYAGVIRLADPENPDRLLYYYVTSSCQLKTSGEEGKLVKYTASLTNGLLEVGRYQFDAQGRMYDLQGNLLTAPAN